MAAISHRNPQQLDNIVMEMNMIAAQAKKAVAYESFIREVAEEAGLDFPVDEDFTPEQLEQLKTHMKSLKEGKETDQAKKAVTYESFILEVAEGIGLVLCSDENLTSEHLKEIKNYIHKINEDHELRLQNEKLTKFILDDIAEKTEFMKTVKIPSGAFPALPEENGDNVATHNASGCPTQASDANDESNVIRRSQRSASKASRDHKITLRTTANASNSRSHKTVSFALPGPNEGGARSEKSPADATQADDAGDEGNSDKKRRRVSSPAMKLHSSTIVNLRSMAPNADCTIAEKASGGVTPAIVATDEDKGKNKTRSSSPLTSIVPSPTEAHDGGSSGGSTPTAITQVEGVKSETTGNKQRSSTRAIKPPKKFRDSSFDLADE